MNIKKTAAKQTTLIVNWSVLLLLLLCQPLSMRHSTLATYSYISLLQL